MTKEVQYRGGRRLDAAGIDLRSFDIAEMCSLDLDMAVAFPRGSSDLTSDVFTLSVAIGPDDKRIGTSRLIFDIFCNRFVVLSRGSVSKVSYPFSESW